MEFILTLTLVALLLSPLYGVYRRKVAGKPVKNALYMQIFSVFAIGGVAVALGISGANAQAAEAAAATASGIGDFGYGMGMLGAALATGLSGIGGGVAVAAAASAALGAISENEKNFGKALIIVGLAEGIALYGMIISFMILGKL